MKIINPLYDNAFKYLMDNEQIAKMVLSIILGETVLSLQSKPQETQLFTDTTRKTARYDFKAIIRGNDNLERTILIELQKYKHPDPIMRFREYLAENYRKEETIITSSGEEQKQALPIVTIYILGYKITQADILALQVGRNVKDLIWDTPITEKLDFVELLTHVCFIFQVGVKPEKLRGTRLEYFLSLFSQKLHGEEANYLIDIELDETAKKDKHIGEIVKYLNQATLDEGMVRSLKYEAQYEKGVRTIEQELKEMLIAKETALAKEAEAIAKAEKERAEKEIALKKEAKAIAEKESALAKITKLVHNLRAKNFSKEDISVMTGLNIAEVESILHSK